MTLEEFEKTLAEEKLARDSERGEDSKLHRHRHHRQHHHSSRADRVHEHGESQRRKHRDDNRQSRDDSKYEQKESNNRRHRHKRPRDERSPERRQRQRKDLDERAASPSQEGGDDAAVEGEKGLHRDAWMEAPPTMEVLYARRDTKKSSDCQFVPGSEASKDTGKQIEDDRSLHEDEESTRKDDEVDYNFGDVGSKWRMMKLKAVYCQAADTGRSVEDVAIERYGSLMAFDNAREEETELERRKTYGKGYVSKQRPNGELYQERKLDEAAHRPLERPIDRDTLRENLAKERRTDDESPTLTAIPLDQTTLNRLKAQVMKAKLKGSVEYANLETEYTAAMATFANRKEPDVVVLGPMESRMLAGNRRAPSDGKRKDDDGEGMSIAEMVREERMTKGQAGGEGRRFAERIAKDAKFDNDLDYLDENASKLARRIEKSEINLKNTAVHELQRMNRILDKCPLCHHEDTNTASLAPVVSLATRTYLTLPTLPEISRNGACIVPLQHRVNLLECDDDEWEEIRNFMKCLKRMYHAEGRDVIFYENAAAPHRGRHAAMEVVPLPTDLGNNAPAFFKEAILSTASDWTQHRPLIDTLSRARNPPDQLGKLAFRRSLAKQMPYFHVWFDLDGGLGHVVEDEQHWPKGDLFAREVLGGMLDLPADVVRRQGRWSTDHGRLETFRKIWKEFDWTHVLT